MNQKILSITLRSAVALAVLGATAAVRAEEPFNGIETYAAGAHVAKRVVTNTVEQTTNSEAWVPLPGARIVFFLQPGQSALFNTSFTAESRCSEAAAAPNYCQVRILIDGNEASPAATASVHPFAFDSTDFGTETPASWEAHAMDRHACVKNDGVVVQPVVAQVQWRVTNVDGGAAPTFWLDDSSFTLLVAKGCTRTQTPFDQPTAAIDG